jgi:arylsulfatase A-like enzyme
MPRRPRLGHADRRRALVVLVLGTAAAAATGAALAVVALARGHLLPLDPLAAFWLVARWAAVGAASGAVLGGAGALATLALPPQGLGRVVPGLVVVLGTGAALWWGARSAPTPWRAFGDPIPYPPLTAHRAPGDAPNLVLVTVDTLRRDHLELYGYGRATAPSLTALAAQGAVFEAAIAQAPETLRSLGALATGLYPHVLEHERAQRDEAGPFLGAGFHTVAERLAAAGYDTAAFVSNWYLMRRNGFAQGFAVYDDQSGMVFENETKRSRNADHVLAPALAWLAQAQHPFFLWVHLMDPHHPYEPTLEGPWERSATFASYRAEYDARSVAAYTGHLKALRTGRSPLRPGELDYLVGRYDAEILQADDALGRLVDRLASLGFDERNTVIVITADHGEEFADHGGMLHGHTCYDELVRVPLVLRGRGIPPGRRIAAQVRSIDVTATLLDLAGVVPDGGIDGRSLRPMLDGGPAPPEAALSFRDTAYVAYRTPARKLVVAFAPYELGTPPWTPWDGLPFMARVAIGRRHRSKVGLWRLDEDARERRNVLSAAPGESRELYEALARHRRAHPPRVVVSAPEAGLDPGAVEALRALGYVQ